jgi:chromosome segregation ATPase
VTRLTSIIESLRTELVTVRSGSYESEKVTVQLRADIQSRDARIAELEARISSLRKELSMNDELVQRLRLEMRQVSEQTTIIQVC